MINIIIINNYFIINVLNYYNMNIKIIHFFQTLKAFVTEPFLNFKKGIELLKNHGLTNYHKRCAEKGSSFIQNSNAGESKFINNIYSYKTKSIMEANRKRLTSIIETIIFCGHNNISLRGTETMGYSTMNQQ